MLMSFMDKCLQKCYRERHSKISFSVTLERSYIGPSNTDTCQFGKSKRVVMHEKIKNSCPNCCQPYSLKNLTSKPKSNIPLFIKCGHTMCECCVRNIVKFGEPIECKICLRTTEIKSADMAKLQQHKNQLYNLFPVNVSALGELALELIADESEKEDNKAEDYFIDLQAILDSTEQTQGKCLECHGATTKMCQQCATVICEDCFTKSHMNFAVFKNHVLQNIELQMSSNNCKLHSQKSLEYYCKDCVKSICMDCLMVGSEKSCKNHDVVPIAEIAEKFLSDLREISPQVDTTFRRLTKTAVDIGHLLLNMDNESGSPELRQVIASIEQHFSKLQATVQSHRQEVMENVARLRRIECDSLLRAREEVAAAIKQSKQVMDGLKLALDPQNNQTTNLSALLEDAKKIVDRPWCLSKEESDKDSLKVCVSEELCLLVSDYVQLVGNAQARYALRASCQLPAVPPPPRAPVFPPALPRDVRFNKPEADRSTPAAKGPTGGTGVRAAKGSSSRSSPEMKKAAIQAVLPFDEKKTLIELKAGVQELAHISHMVDPHHFYVRRLRDDALLAELEDQLRESLGEVPRDVTVGKMYAVKYENSWKRCRVDGIDEATKLPTYRVTCFDFGYTTSVNADDLRDIPPALTLCPEARYPALALRCRLANCAPESGWRHEHTDLLLRMVDRAPVLVHVRRAGACSACDVTTRAGLSAARALRFHARAGLDDAPQPYPEVAGEAQPRLQPADITLRSESEADVLITHVVSPDKFYVRESRLEEDYVKLCQELNNAYDARDESDLIYLPKEGLVCVALAEPGAGWVRAQVLLVNTPEDVRVLEPDSGRRLAVPWHRLRAIRPRFTALRALAIESHLAGLTPAGGRWRAEASELLAQCTGRNLRLIVARQSHRRSLGAVLVDPAGSICLNQELIAKQLAVVDRSIEFKHLTAKYFPPEEQTRPQTPDISTVSSDTSNGAMMAKTYQEEFQLESKELIRLEAKILDYESPSLIYISLVHQQKTFNELFEDIQKFYSKRRTTRREKWKADDRCCALCMQSETWRRATIIKTERDKVTVFYTDFAQTETVPISNLKKLHSDFEVIGDAAVKCHLAGVLPADPAGEWPSLTKEFLKDKLDEYKRVFVTKVGEFLTKSMPVQLWVYHTELGSALEPNESSWRCLNAELVARGLALPDTTQTDTTEMSNGQDDELRFLNVRGAVGAWLLPGPAAGCSSPGRAGARWLPPDPLRASEFTAMPTYIDNDGIIYLHDVAQNDDLDFIRDTLQMAFKEDDPIAAFCTWRVGEPCIARYYLDKSFYRGTVVAVDREQASCLVQYVDYGNSERCAFTDLRKRVALNQIPMQAHKCCLHRIKPISDQWDLTVLDYIHKAIVEKKCFVKVAGPAVDGVTPVDLKYDKLWINDHLVEFDLAAYVDGSKPIERQFKKKTFNQKNKTCASSTPERNKNVEITQSIDVSNSSEPDYIVEEDMYSSQASGSPDSFKMSTLVDRSSSASEILDTTNLVTYLRHDEREFSCNIPVINDTNSLELTIIRDAEINPTYEALFEVIKEQGKNMPPLGGTYEYKPCIALFEDNWYRASILKYSEAKNLLKVHYVDYGNIGIVPLSNAREISKDWVCLPPACVTARLHGLVVNPELSPDSVIKAFISTFLDKGPFRATIVDYADFDNSVPLVELRNSDGELVYHKLIEDNVLLRDTGDNSTSD